MTEFFKMHGTGNDFVVIADLDNKIELNADFVRFWCDRHFGIGADGLIRIGPSPSNSFFMDYWNHDGSVGEMCGNGTRVVGKWLGDRGFVGDEVDLETRAGVKKLTLHRQSGLVETVTVDMGQPKFGDLEEVILTDGGEYKFSFVSMGNPHAVIFVDDIDNVDLENIGLSMQAQSQRFPESVNVEIATVRPDGAINERTYERGVGETLACGTGACAVAVAAQRKGLIGEQVQMHVRGGHLTLEWKPGHSVFMTGSAVEVFNGNLP